MAAVTERSTETSKLKNKARASLALLLIAVISISTATYAWFTLSNSTSVQSMIVEVSTGVTLKAYAGTPVTEDSKNPAKYFSVIKSEDPLATLKPGEIITDALPTGLPDGVIIESLADVKLWPVTSGNGITLYTDGINTSAAISTGVGPERMYYLQLTLTFLSDTDMSVYLNGDNSSGAQDGTKVDPNTSGLQADEDAVKALRLSFEADNTAVIYEPDNLVKGSTTNVSTTTLKGKALADSTTGSAQATFTDLGTNIGRGTSPVLFTLKKGEPKEVLIRMWVEGEDAECVNNNANNVNIEQAKMSVRLRFSGADSSGRFIETPVN